ncbi:hypothetical protein BCR39DRAFT_531035 [Naematelia encephala]|uniref:F-box domain-containing protein n=1 Tax=Naematelia encephala TaxID=71784 RepID=A0A1Y2B5G5_9TREE|nr:hypothetical protein BCR39DRAFT_531035 [Naematelia encephala]
MSDFLVGDIEHVPAKSPSRTSPALHLLALPKEILENIACNLSSQAALHAARSCKALSELLGPYIYRRIDSIVQCCEYHGPWGEHENSSIDIRARREQIRLAHLARAFERVPARCRYVIEASFTVLPDTIDDITELLALLSPYENFQSLTIAFHPDIISSHHLPPASFFEKIHSMDISFPHLSKIVVQNLPVELTNYLPVLIARVPRLKSIVISSEREYRNYRLFNLICPLPGQLDLSHLRYIKLDCVERGTPEGVRKMVKGAINLDTLVLRHGMAGTGRPTVIVDHPNLRRLDWRYWRSESFENMSYEDGLEKLKVLVIGRMCSSLDQNIVMVSNPFHFMSSRFPLNTVHLNLTIDMNVQDYHIPNIPSLETVILSHLPPNDPSSFYNESNTNGLVWETSIPELLRTINHAPNLLNVQILDPLNPHSSDHVPIHQWDKLDIRGTAFKTYTNGSHELVLCRSRFRGPNGLLTGIHGQSTWADWILYDHRPVPPLVFEQVVEVIGHDMQWVEPGRGLFLPSQAWEILRIWARDV